MLTAQRPQLTAVDRCDGCGAQAYATAAKPGNSNLLFCLHHGNKNSDILKSLGWSIEWDNESVSSL